MTRSAPDADDEIGPERGGLLPGLVAKQQGRVFGDLVEQQKGDVGRRQHGFDVVKRPAGGRAVPARHQKGLFARILQDPGVFRERFTAEKHGRRQIERCVHAFLPISEATTPLFFVFSIAEEADFFNTVRAHSVFERLFCCLKCANIVKSLHFYPDFSRKTRKTAKKRAKNVCNFKKFVL